MYGSKGACPLVIKMNWQLAAKTLFGDKNEKNSN
jgi:hypothetical protein